MNILIVEDNQRHIEAAREQFAGHEITVPETYSEAFRLLTENSQFDLALLDLMLPAEADTLGPEGMRYFGHEMPIGLVLALRAAMVGVPKVICITDANHHCHPMSAALDWISPPYWEYKRQSVLQIQGSDVLIGHAPFDDDDRKNWRKAFTVLEGR